MSKYYDKPIIRYLTYMKDDDDYYYIDLFHKDGTPKKRKSFPTEKELQEYAYSLDPIKGWIDELKEDNGKLVYNQSTKDVYNNYNQYCIANGLMQMSNIEVSRRICKEFGVTTVTRRVDGKRTRLFARNGIKESD